MTVAGIGAADPVEADTVRIIHHKQEPVIHNVEDFLFLNFLSRLIILSPLHKFHKHSSVIKKGISNFSLIVASNQFKIYINW
ncbi:MAG: hypothetical protein IPG90_16475 [Bacteroidetes bacterium]|nr:hypothetical protein [Bacteroidota bacterium]MBK6839660.1 hypothetical protein [Bacteroidota bacterium]MBK9543709.1 hypothetical protein [Bacteroidota bacterium]MBP6401965.1 hypothetical protein [Bacteroidia bacterium]